MSIMSQQKHQNQHGFAPFAPPTKRYQSIITYENITISVMIFQSTPLRVDGNRFLRAKMHNSSDHSLDELSA